MHTPTSTHTHTHTNAHKNKHTLEEDEWLTQSWYGVAICKLCNKPVGSKVITVMGGRVGVT